jgi:hypothetical protein
MSSSDIFPIVVCCAVLLFFSVLLIRFLAKARRKRGLPDQSDPPLVEFVVDVPALSRFLSERGIVCRWCHDPILVKSLSDDIRICTRCGSFYHGTCLGEGGSKCAECPHDGFQTLSEWIPLNDEQISGNGGNTIRI